VVKCIYTFTECELCLTLWWFSHSCSVIFLDNLITYASTFYIVKMRRRLPAFHIYTQLTNIKLQTQFFTTVTLVQFCVSKSPPFNVTSLISVQLACNNTEVVNILHPELIGRSPINRFLFVTQSEYHAKYIHTLFINSTHIGVFNSTELILQF
jgi:hypothetical protein